MSPLRIAFLGTPAIAERVLRALIGSPHELAAVYCQPPRPAGRGHKPQMPPVARAAEEARLPLFLPERLDADAAAAFVALGLDAAVVAAYGLILPRAMIESPRLGCLNVHASLLPRWRGAAPVERAIMAGDGETGVTIMRMDEGLDTGPILLAEPFPIGPAATAADLYAEIARCGPPLLLAALDGLAEGRLAPRPQPAEGASYARKIGKTEREIDWRLPAATLERKVRALQLSGGVFYVVGGERIKVLAAALAPGSGAPGSVLDDDLAIACGDGALRPLLLQRPGRAPVETKAFLRGYPLPRATRLPCPAAS